MSGKTSAASGLGSRMPHTPDASVSPNAYARMVSGCPLPATTGSARCAPASASLRSSGSGLISLLSGMKPETIAPGGTAIGNGRSAIACAAAARTSAGRASRRASAALRSSVFDPAFMRYRTASAGRAQPALLRNIEDDSIGILELALEVLFFLIVAEIEEERAAGAFDALLRFGNVVDLETEMMRA